MFATEKQHKLVLMFQGDQRIASQIVLLTEKVAIDRPSVYAAGEEHGNEKLNHDMNLFDCKESNYTNISINNLVLSANSWGCSPN